MRISLCAWNERAVYADLVSPAPNPAMPCPRIVSRRRSDPGTGSVMLCRMRNKR